MSIFVQHMYVHTYWLSRGSCQAIQKERFFTLHSLLHYAHSIRCVMKNKGVTTGEKEREAAEQVDGTEMFSMHGICGGNEILRRSLNRSKYIYTKTISINTSAEHEVNRAINQRFLGTIKLPASTLLKCYILTSHPLHHYK